MFKIEQVPSVLQAHITRWAQDFHAALGERDLLGALPETVSKEAFSSQLTRVFVGSECIATLCTRYPDWLMQLVQSGDLFRPQTEHDLAALTALIQSATDDKHLEACVRQARNKAMLRIIWRDLNRLASMAEVTAELSAFAERCVRDVADYHQRALVAMYGEPIGGQSGLKQPFFVIGMGKLGAAELNISSDIDLIFTFPEAGSTDHASRSISNQEFFTKLGQRLIRTLDAMTVDGFVFRVDMRLRPHGESGPLVMSFNGMEHYYQTQGREWERYAMIKARTIAIVGGEQPHQAWEALRDMLAPFTYRQYIDFSAIESLREMKNLIARQVQRKGMHLDVKLGEGGIREIEFVVQVFQLIRGGRDLSLRKRKVPVLLPLLENDGYLPYGTGSALLEAYIFLRNTEHAIQGYQDKQTQALPTDEQGQARLAWVMGFAHWDDFFAELSRLRDRVNAEFQAIIAAPDEEATLDRAALDFYLSLWDGSLAGEEADAALSVHGIDTPDALLKSLSDLRQCRAVLQMQASARTRLDHFIPRLLLVLFEEAANGDGLPLPVPDVLGRIIPLIEAVVRRSAYLALLMENPSSISQLIRLCAASPWIADQLATYPALLDELLNVDNLYAPPDKARLRDELRCDVLRLTWDDLEGHMEALRYFRSAYALRVAASEVTGALPLMKVSDYLTYIAEVVLEHVLRLAWEQMVQKHGYPQREDGKHDTEPAFIIVGYGKLGGIELGHGSDLDLVFIHSADTGLSTDGDKSIDNLTFYTRLGQRIIHVLSTYTPSGKLYEVDMRLRPSGDSGMLVCSLSAFERYQENNAWTWEHQALVRARVVAGQAALADAFEQARTNVLCRSRDQDTLRKDVSDMRRKMRDQLGSEAKARARNLSLFDLKQDAGGIVDIEFMVQYAALAWAHDAPEVIRYSDNIRILGSLEEARLLDADSVAQLIAAYKAYRSTGHRLALQRKEAVLEGDHHFIEERAQVTAIWDRLIGQP